MALELGFDGVDVTLIAAAISEVSRNIVEHASCGEIVLRPVHQGAKHGLCVVARDEGPGIPDVAIQIDVSPTAQGGGNKWLPEGAYRARVPPPPHNRTGHASRPPAGRSDTAW